MPLLLLLLENKRILFTIKQESNKTTNFNEEYKATTKQTEIRQKQQQLLSDTIVNGHKSHHVLEYGAICGGIWDLFFLLATATAKGHWNEF